jgi:hypothetical protein
MVNSNLFSSFLQIKATFKLNNCITYLYVPYYTYFGKIVIFCSVNSYVNIVLNINVNEENGDGKHDHQECAPNESPNS